MTESAEQDEAHRLINEALGDGQPCERTVVDLVLAAGEAYRRGDAAAAGTMLSEHLTHAEDHDLAAYHVCGAAALASGHLLDGQVIQRVAPDGEDGERLLDLAVQAINSASVEDLATMTLILDVVWAVRREEVCHLAAALIALRANVVTLDEDGRDE